MGKVKTKKESKIDTRINDEALRWVKENMGLEISDSKHYNSPRVSSEYPDCSLPLTFDTYSACSFGCVYCCVEGTPVSTTKGRRAIETLEVGDKVYSYNTEKQQVETDTVTSTMEKNATVAYSITLENGSNIEVTGKHPVYVESRGWVKAKDLRKGDSVGFMKSPGVAFNMTQKNPMKKKSVRKKMSKSLKKRYASGELDGLKKKVGEAVRKTITKYNKTDKARAAVSKRMKSNNPMHDKKTAKKVSKTQKEGYTSGRLTPTWLGKKKPDATKRMLSSDNPMKDPAIAKATLQKAAKTLIKNGNISEGEKRVKAILRKLGVNFVHQMAFDGPNRCYIIDFFLPDHNCCIEYDGHSRHYTKEGIKKDKVRDKFMSKKYSLSTVRLHRNEAFIGDVGLQQLIERRVGL